MTASTVLTSRFITQCTYILILSRVNKSIALGRKMLAWCFCCKCKTKIIGLHRVNRQRLEGRCEKCRTRTSVFNHTNRHRPLKIWGKAIRPTRVHVR